MNDEITSWIEQAWDVLDSIPGASETLVQERIRWEEFRELDTLEVVIFGAYDAGKTSLLKRLLADWKVPIPEWVSVSGRRETFESKRVKARGLGLVDTPGLGSGSIEHDELTLTAMRLADAYLWVLPPQLVTTGKERFLEVIFGEVGIAEATIAIVARMDEAGVDPNDNETGFAELCTKKKEELSSFIAESSTTRQLRSIHCIVADPYQMVGNTPNPKPEFYDIGRNWDEMADLAREVLDLQKQRRNLRPQAERRFVRLLMSDVRDELRLLTGDLALSDEGMKNEVERHAIYEQRLDALQRQTRAELHRMLEDALLSVSRSGNLGADSIRSLEEILAKVIDEWSEGSFAEYLQLAGELELEVRERMTSPSMDGFRRFAQDTENREENTKAPKVNPLKTGRKALAFVPSLRKAFETYAAAELGMSLKIAANRLEKLESSGETVEAFIKSQGHRAAFRGAKHARKASQFVKWAGVLDAVGPLVEQLGSALIEVVGEVMTAKQANERAQMRLEIRSQLRSEAEALEETAAADFDSTCDGLRQWLSERLLVYRSCRDDLSIQLRKLKDSIDSIDNLIAVCPSCESL